MIKANLLRKARLAHHAAVGGAGRFSVAKLFVIAAPLCAYLTGCAVNDDDSGAAESGSIVTSVNSQGATISITNTDADGNPPDDCWYTTTTGDFSETSDVCWDLAPTAYDNSIIKLEDGTYLMSYRWDNVFQCCPSASQYNASYDAYEAHMGTVLLDANQAVVAGTNNQSLDLRTNNPFIPDMPALGQDGRLFWYDGESYLVYTDYATSTSSMGNKLMYLVKIVEDADTGQYVVDSSSFIRLLPYDVTADNITSQKQKNWAPFEYTDETSGEKSLYMVYNWTSYQIFKVDLTNDGSDISNPNTSLVSTTQYDLKNTLWRKYGSPRGGTPAVYDSDFGGYVALIHSSIIENADGNHNAPYGDTPYNTAYYTTSVVFDADPPFDLKYVVPQHFDYVDDDDPNRSAEGTDAQRAKGSRPEYHSFYKYSVPVQGYGQNKIVIFPSGLVSEQDNDAMTMAYSRSCLDVFTADLSKSAIQAAQKPYELESTEHYCGLNPSDSYCQAAHRIMYPAWAKAEDFLLAANRGSFGYSGAAPENSTGAVEAVSSLNSQVPANDEYLFNKVEAIQLDVTLSEDKLPMAFHDYYLDRLTSASGPVSKQSSNELAQLYLYDRQGAISDTYTMSTLLDLLITVTEMDSPYIAILNLDAATATNGQDMSQWTSTFDNTDLMLTDYSTAYPQFQKMIAFRVPYEYSDFSTIASENYIDPETYFYVPVIDGNGKVTSVISKINAWETGLGLQVLAYEIDVSKTDAAMSEFTSGGVTYNNIFDYVAQNTKGGRSAIHSPVADGSKGVVNSDLTYEMPDADDMFRGDLLTVRNTVDDGKYLLVTTSIPTLWQNSNFSSSESIFPNADELDFSATPSGRAVGDKPTSSTNLERSN